MFCLIDASMKVLTPEELPGYRQQVKTSLNKGQYVMTVGYWKNPASANQNQIEYLCKRIPL